MEYPHDTKDGKSNQHEIAFTASKLKHTVLILNQGTLNEKQKISLRINDPRIHVSIDGNPIPAQINPIIDLNNGVVANNTFEIVFFIDFAPLELKKVDLQFSHAQPQSTILSILYSNNTAS